MLTGRMTPVNSMPFHKSFSNVLPMCYPKGKSPRKLFTYKGFGFIKAVRTGLEPATPCVTGMYSNQLNYRTVLYWERKSSKI